MTSDMFRQDPDRNSATLLDDGVVLLPMPLTVNVVTLAESTDDIEDSTSDIALLFWILGLLSFGLGDTVSSFLVFSTGGVERNPFMEAVLQLPGGLLAFVFVKTVAMAVTYAISHIWEGPHQVLIPVMMTMAGVFLTTWNLMQYMKVAG